MSMGQARRASPLVSQVRSSVIGSSGRRAKALSYARTKERGPIEGTC
jgi:hypothetical protein